MKNTFYLFYLVFVLQISLQLSWFLKIGFKNLTSVSFFLQQIDFWKGGGWYALIQENISAGSKSSHLHLFICYFNTFWSRFLTLHEKIIQFDQNKCNKYRTMCSLNLTLFSDRVGGSCLRIKTWKIQFNFWFCC